MVSVKNLISFVTIAASTLGASAASVPRQYAENGAPVTSGGSWLPNPAAPASSRRQLGSTWDDYHRQSEWLAEKGMCRKYIKPTTRDVNWPCRQYCEKLTGDYSAACSTGHMANADGSLKPGYALLENLDGEQYTYGGECHCISISAGLEAKIVEGLETSGAVICTVWMFSIKQVLEKGTYAIPGGSTVMRVVKAIGKAVRKAAGSGKGKEAWANMVRDTCGPKGYDVNMEIERAFDIFKGAPEN